MVCIYCGQPTKVTNSRSKASLLKIWRRRQCDACQAIFSTFERVDDKSFIVERRNGNLSAFSRDKLFLSIYESCKHRKSNVKDAGALTDTIITGLIRQAVDGKIKSVDIVEMSSQVLRRFDKAAHVHYLAYHPH